MDKKLHIKAVAGRNIKVDAYWYKYGDKMDCYLTPAQFKDYVQGFLEYEIVTDEDSTPVSIVITDAIVKEGEDSGKQIQQPRHNESKSSGKNTKKVVR